MNYEKLASAKLLTLNKGVTILVLCCSFFLFLDYLLPGAFVQTAILKYNVETGRARGSVSTTYYIVSDKYTFPISNDFLAISNVGDTIHVEVSRMLKIINAYGLRNHPESYTHYARYLSGILFPLVLLLVSLFSLRLNYTSEGVTYMFLGINALALLFTAMTVINVSHLF